MKRTALAELESRFGRREAVVVPWIIGSMAGLVVPLITLLIGWMIELLIRASVASTLPESIQLGPFLSLSTVWLDADQGPLRGVLALMFLAFALAVIEAILLLTHYRWAIHYALDAEIWLRRSLYEKNLALAPQQTVIGQRAAQVEATMHWIPQVRDGLLAWYRTVPRHLTQAVACFALAVSIHPMLMILAAIAFVLLWRLYSMIDRHRRQLRPVLVERSHTAQSQLVAMAERGPLVSSVHPEKVNRECFENQLRSYRDAEFKLCDSFLWKTPLLLTLVAMMLSVFCLALSVRILQNNTVLGVSSAMVMLVLIGFGYVSLIKVRRAWGRQGYADLASKRLLDILNQDCVAGTPEPTRKAEPLKYQLSVEGVSLTDTLGHKLLEDVSFQARPGMLVALVATSGLEARTLGDLLLGFGIASKGQVHWDTMATNELVSESIRRHCVWVAPDGPMTSGTLIENLTFEHAPLPTSDLVDAVRLSGAYEAVSELTDSLSTLISPNDDRLKNDALYQLGIARALLRKPSLVVAQEPTERVTIAIENQSAIALRQLTQRGTLVFVLPQRASALRLADLVILLHDHRVAGIGTHNELLEKSELYRHFNYVRFSTLRDVVIG